MIFDQNLRQTAYRNLTRKCQWDDELGFDFHYDI